MVDHIHFPKRVAPLFPTEKVKKVRRRKDKKQDAGFKENLEKEKKTSDEADEDSYEPDQGRRQHHAEGITNQIGSEKEPASSKKKRSTDDPVPDKRIDVHA